MPQKKTRRTVERRRQPRADARLSMRVETDSDAPHVVTESQNISASGVYCTSSHFLPPLSKVALTIVLPRVPGSTSAKELVKCEGIVVRCEPVGRKSERRWELACMFSSLEEHHRMRIEEFVAWRNLQALRRAAGAAALDGAARRARPRAAGTRPRARAAARPRPKAAARRRTVH